MSVKKEEVTTFEGLPESAIAYGRQSGNSTRIADHAIQQLFSGKKIHVQDHHQNGRHRDANYFLFVKICDRLSREHHRDRFIADKDKLTIELL